VVGKVRWQGAPEGSGSGSGCDGGVADEYFGSAPLCLGHDPARAHLLEQVGAMNNSIEHNDKTIQPIAQMLLPA
jgi:hypothetical protein